jgi:hypothetical protein
MRLKFNNILTFFWIAVATSGYTQSIEVKPDWSHFEVLADTSGIFPEEDLIILKNERIIHNSYIRDYPEYFNNETMQKYGRVPVSIEENYLQIYIRNERGARLIWQLQIPVLQERNLMKINLRTRKPSGKITDLKEEDIRFVLNKTSKTKDFASDYSYLPVPGADAGDIVEIFSSYFIPWALKSDEIFFHQYYPTCKSIFTYDHSVDFQVSLIKYNFDRFEHSDYQIVDEGFSYTFENLPGLYSQSGLINHFELPFTVFRIDSIYFHTPLASSYLTVTQPTWDRFLKSYIKDWIKGLPAFSPEEISRPGNFFNVFKSRYPGISDDILACEWHKFLNDSIVLRFISEKESGKTMEYWLKQRISDRNQLIALYIYFFDYFEINYSVYLARDLQYGYLDSSFVYAGQGINVFFGVKEDSLEHFFFPRYENEAFETDEFPSTIRGTLAIGLNFSGENEEVKYIHIPLADREDNWKSRNLYCQVTDPGAMRLKINQRSIYNGDIGKASKVFNDQLFKGNNALEIMENMMTQEPGNIILNEVEFDRDKPATAKQTLNLTYECDNFISRLSDSSFSINVKDVSTLDMYRILPYPRIYGFYTTIPYSNTTRFYLQFDKNIELIGHDTISSKYSNEYGSMHLFAAKVNENILMVETYYSVNSSYLPPYKFRCIDELAGKTNEMLGERIFFRLKD